MSWSDLDRVRFAQIDQQMSYKLVQVWGPNPIIKTGVVLKIKRTTCSRWEKVQVLSSDDRHGVKLFTAKSL